MMAANRKKLKAEKLQSQKVEYNQEQKGGNMRRLCNFETFKGLT